MVGTQREILIDSHGAAFRREVGHDYVNDARMHLVVAEGMERGGTVCILGVPEVELMAGKPVGDFPASRVGRAVTKRFRHSGIEVATNDGLAGQGYGFEVGKYGVVRKGGGGNSSIQL